MGNIQQKYPILLSDSELQHSLAVRRRCCIEHDLAKGFKIQTSTGTEAMVVKIRSLRAQFSAAEKDGEGMALKIFTGAKPFLKADIKPFVISRK